MKSARFPNGLLALALLAAGACSKQDGATDLSGESAKATDALLEQVAEGARASSQANQARRATAALPQPDPEVALGSYVKMEDGKQLMFMYVASSSLPPDYEKLASAFSTEYQQATDNFRKRDLMRALRPQLDAQIGLARARRYAWIDVEEPELRPYDFDRGGFGVGEFQNEGWRYFSAGDYKLSWANGDAVAFAPVKDESTARTIEAMRTDWNDRPQLRVYFFAQSADLANEAVKALVTRVQIRDQTGRVLSEYGPGGMP